MLDMSSLEFELLATLRKETPDGTFVTDRYMAVWSELDGRMLLIPGNFLHLSDEEKEQVLQERQHAALKI
jgi:hypothetical protein